MRHHVAVCVFVCHRSFTNTATRDAEPKMAYVLKIVAKIAFNRGHSELRTAAMGAVPSRAAPCCQWSVKVSYTCGDHEGAHLGGPRRKMDCVECPCGRCDTASLSCGIYNVYLLKLSTYIYIW